GQGRKDLRDLRKAKRVDVDGFGAAADRDLLVALEVSGCAARRAMCPRVDRDGGAELAGEPLEARGEVYHVADRGVDEPIARPHRPPGPASAATAGPPATPTPTAPGALSGGSTARRWAAAISSQAASTETRAWSGIGSGAPKPAMTPSPRNSTTVPPRRSITA